MNGIATTITVRVIARDGKFLGDDIGGARITVRDADTKEILAQGVTSGGSGENGEGGVMCARLRRGEPINTEGASLFNAILNLETPRRIEVAAFGPLAALQSANTVSATTWVYPGKDITLGDGFLLELPGLIVQIIDPPTHYGPQTLPQLKIQANVAMMCGCPIDPKSGSSKICPHLPDAEQPWLPGEFEVAAIITTAGSAPVTVPLEFQSVAPANAPGQFFGAWTPPAAGGTFQITVYAYQASTGNTGVDIATFIAPKAS